MAIDGALAGVLENLKLTKEVKETSELHQIMLARTELKIDDANVKLDKSLDYSVVLLEVAERSLKTVSLITTGLRQLLVLVCLISFVIICMIIIRGPLLWLLYIASATVRAFCYVGRLIYERTHLKKSAANAQALAPFPPRDEADIIDENEFRNDEGSETASYEHGDNNWAGFDENNDKSDKILRAIAEQDSKFSIGQVSLIVGMYTALSYNFPGLLSSETISRGNLSSCI